MISVIHVFFLFKVEVNLKILGMLRIFTIVFINEFQELLYTWLQSWYGNSPTTTLQICGPLELYCMLNHFFKTLKNSPDLTSYYLYCLINWILSYAHLSLNLFVHDKFKFSVPINFSILNLYC